MTPARTELHDNGAFLDPRVLLLEEKTSGMRETLGRMDERLKLVERILYGVAGTVALSTVAQLFALLRR